MSKKKKNTYLENRSILNIQTSRWNQIDCKLKTGSQGRGKENVQAGSESNKKQKNEECENANFGNDGI